MGVITAPPSSQQPGSAPPAAGAPPSLRTPPTGPSAPEPPPRRRRWGWGRLLIGAILVLLCSAGASAVFVLEQVHNLRDALKQNASLKVGSGVLANAGWGEPQTLLLVGDDWRPKTKYYHVAVPHLANEMLLVRLDSSKPYISMMSIPRELEATIYPPHGQPFVNRLNSAYHFGIGALVTTIKRNLGLSVNHVIVATFASFKRAVNQMGCVYSTVDHRYYNLNQGTPDTNYQSINLQPGYQRMCGEQALEFVSYRHTDTSLVRDARDQSFLLDVKKQYGPTLVDNVSRFEHIFGEAVRTDPGLQSTTGLLNLLGTLISMSARTVRQVNFQVNLQPTGANPCSCDTATQQQIAASVHAFLYGGSAIPRRQVAAQANAVHNKRGVAQLPLVPSPPSALGQARAAAAKLSFPLEYPRVEDRGGSVELPALRSYTIAGPDGTTYPAYVAVFDDGGLGQYYDVQGMTWTTAPQFDSPDQTIHVGSRTYQLFYESSNLRMIAWYEHDAVYWVRNTLTDSVPNGEMLAIAEEAQPFITTTGGAQHTPMILRAARVPFHTTAKITPLTTKEMVGGIAGLVTLVGLPLLMFFGIRRFLDLRHTRVELARGQLVGGRLPIGDLPPAAALTPSAAGLTPALGLGRGLGLAHGAGLAATGEGAGATLLPRPATSGRWIGSPTVYRRSRLRRAAVIVPLLLALALGGAGAAAYVLLRHHSRPTPVHRAKRVTQPLIPTVPVAVLNSTSTPGAAGKLAASLRADRIQVVTVGNVSTSLPPGNEILYMAGQQTQAKRLARLLGSQVTTVAPIDPATAAAAGSRAQLVVVIT